MSNQPALSIIIPAYNEESRLPTYLDAIQEYLEKQESNYELLVVDDGSSDGTANLVGRFAERNPRIGLIRLPVNRGKGHAVRTGMLKASGALRLFADADGATPIAELERLSKAIGEGAAVAIGSRALAEEGCVVQAKLHRKVIGSIFNLIVRTLTIAGIHDTQCGFKLFTAESAGAVFPLQRIDGFGFDVEILFIADRKRFPITEVPVNWKDVKGSKVRLVHDSCRMFLDLLKVRFNWLRGAYSRSC